MIDVCETVKIATDNEDGFYECDADKIPEGAELFEGEVKSGQVSFDYAVRKYFPNGEGFTGRAKVVKDTREQAENYMLEKDLDLDVYGIEERERK